MNVTALKRYQGQVEEGLRIELAQLDRKLHEASERLAVLQTSAELDAQRYLAETASGLTADEVATRFLEWEALTRTITRTKDIVDEARKLRDEKQAEVLETSKERKQIATLDERQMARERRRLDRLEQGRLDDLAADRYVRRQR